MEDKSDRESPPSLDEQAMFTSDGPIPPETSGPPGQSTEDACQLASVSQRIGHYHLRKEIGRGGMGAVYEATQESPRRTVALKLMRHGIASRSALRRFEYESQILARLRHPSIAPVYEAGTHKDDTGTTPYFAMEYIPGALSITRYAREKKLSTRQKLELFTQVCDAVHYGHQKGIIHRDLKPGNILVDQRGQVKIIDFGVARGTDSDMAITTLQTDIGQLIGTLPYMSPEQFLGDPHDLDARSDIYTLGVVLYELLCERLPYHVTRAAIHEAARIIQEEEPARMSTVNRTLRGDVETIVTKAMDKKRDGRYRSALELADDITRYLNHEPILAHPASVLYRTRKSLRRHRVPVGVALVVFLLAVVAANRQFKANRESLRASDAALAVARSAAGNTALDVGLSEAARVVRECTAAIELQPGLAMAYALRGKAYQRLNQLDKAGADCEQALRLDPSNSLALRTLGFVHYERNDFVDALDAYNRGITGLQKRNEAMAEDFHNRAQLRLIMGDYDLALADANLALDLHPGKALLYGNRGLARRCTGDLDGAIADFTRFAEQPNWTFPAYLWIWETRMLRDDPVDRRAAADALAAAGRAAGNNPSHRALMQAILDVIGGTRAADDVLDVADTVERRGFAYYYLGAIALVRGEDAIARDMFQQCYDIDDVNARKWPEHQLARWHLARGVRK